MVLVILVYTLLPVSKLFLLVPLFGLFLTIYVTSAICTMFVQFQLFYTPNLAIHYDHDTLTGLLLRPLMLKVKSIENFTSPEKSQFSAAFGTWKSGVRKSFDFSQQKTHLYVNPRRRTRVNVNPPLDRGYM